MHGNGNLFDRGAEGTQTLGGLPHFLVDIVFAHRESKSFRHHADTQPRHATAQRCRVFIDANVVLTRIEAILASDYFEQQCVVGDVCRHGADVIDGRFDRHHPGIGHEAVGRFHAVTA